MTGMFLRVILALMLSSLLSVQAKADPMEDEIRAHILRALGEEARVESFRFKDFPDTTAGYGRVSIVGEVSLTSSYFEESHEGFMIRELEKNGFQKADIERIGNNLGYEMYGRFARNQYYESVITYSAGDPIPFKAELRYQETISGFDFDGPIYFNRPSGTNPMWERSILVGSDEYNGLLMRFLSEKSKYGNWFELTFSAKEQKTGGVATAQMQWDTAIAVNVPTVFNYSGQPRATSGNWVCPSLAGPISGLIGDHIFDATENETGSIATITFSESARNALQKLDASSSLAVKFELKLSASVGSGNPCQFIQF